MYLPKIKRSPSFICFRSDPLVRPGRSLRPLQAPPAPVKKRPLHHTAEGVDRPRDSPASGILSIQFQYKIKSRFCQLPAQRIGIECTFSIKKRISRAPHTKKETVASASLHLQRLRTGAADEARTRYLHLGKVALYQMSYGRICGRLFQDFRFWCLRSESNQ